MSRFWFLLHFLTLLLAGSAYSANITLQAHQEFAVNYLKNHPQQKGLLLFHALGSGKTYLALAYAETQPDKQVFIILPRFLKSNWLSQMDSYGVKNPGRYHVVAMEDAWRNIQKKDLSKSILIIDEVHKLINQIRYAPAEEGERYSQLYAKLQSAEKIIALTGTPIFTHASDIAYIGNLLEQENKYPYNPEQFRQQYMAVKPVTSLVRGHVLESKLVYGWTPFWIIMSAVTAFITAGGGPFLVASIGLTGGMLVPQLNEWYPIHEISFREFRSDLFKNFASTYVSYYAPTESNLNDYPRKTITEVRADYTSEQTNFFLNFSDEDLSDENLSLLLADTDAFYSKDYLRLNTHNVQRNFLHNENEGRQIGNLALKDAKGRISEPLKFLEIKKIIEKNPGRVAVYSNYFHNGIMQFAHFLDRHNLGDQYVLLTPDLDVKEQNDRLNAYNSGKKRIILIHPEITEGVSLLETEQMHILEPVSNIALLDQIIGRAVRFRSHSNLPENRREVKIFLWEASINYGMMSEANRIRRSHWQHRFAEVNPSLWSKGILELDLNYFRKDETPDARVKRNQHRVSADMKSFEELIKMYSIEKAS